MGDGLGAIHANPVTDLTAEPVNREERARMLAQAKTHGYISDYRGIRISSSSKRFLVEKATVWNIQKP